MSRRSGERGRAVRCVHGQIASAALPKAAGERRFTAVLLAVAAQRIPVDARNAIVADANRLLKGEWEMLGIVRTDAEQPRLVRTR